MKTLLPDAARIRLEEGILNVPLYRAARLDLLGFIQRLQSAANVRELGALALDLYVDFAARQNARDQLIPSHKNKTTARIRSLIDAGAPGGALGEEQQLLGRIRETDEALKGVQHAVRVIADGIVWHALDYDRGAVCVLSQGERVGRLSRGPGLDHTGAVARPSTRAASRSSPSAATSTVSASATRSSDAR